MMSAVSQDPEVVEYCTKHDAYSNFVEQTEQDLRVKISYEVDADLLVLNVNSTFPAITEVELNSENLKARSTDFNVHSKCLKLETQLKNLKEFEAEIVLRLGQEAFSFNVTIDPENPNSFEDVLDLPKKPFLGDQNKKNFIIDAAMDFNNDIREIITEFQPEVAIGDVVTLTKQRVGRVCFIGELKGKKGIFYGIDLFLGTGKHDGVVKGKRYFQARYPNSGCFVKAKTIRGFGICGGDAHLKPRMSGISATEMHGLMVEHDWEDPIEVVTCAEENRPGYNSMPSHEYRDDPRTLSKKVALLAELIRASKNCMAYTGAGISTGAGIDDYASKKTGNKSKMNEKRAKVKKPRYAKPTLGHRVLTQLFHEGHMKHWIQQNHDGLPQKAGYPQHHINEIHGGWWDVSNTVVPMSGSLRGDLFSWMTKWQKKTDLCLAMGTSLCGMNADKCVSIPSKKYRDQNKGNFTEEMRIDFERFDEQDYDSSDDESDSYEHDPHSIEHSLGSIIIGLQRTPYDKISSIRFYGTIDEIVALLAREMNLTIPPYQTLVPDIPKEAIIEEYVYRVPYDSEGKLTTDPDEMIIWDIRKGQKVIMAIGSGKGFEGTVNGFYPETPHIAIKTLRQYQDKNFGKQTRSYYMGNWWIETITKGLWHTIPFYNKNLVLQKDFDGNSTN